MAFKRILKEEFVEELNYETLKLPKLKDICENYAVPTTGTKAELIERIKLCEQELYMFDPIYETSADKKYFIGVDIKDQTNIHRMNKMVYDGLARRAHGASLGCSFMLYYETQTKIKL